MVQLIRLRSSLIQMIANLCARHAFGSIYVNRSLHVNLKDCGLFICCISRELRLYEHWFLELICNYEQRGTSACDDFIVDVVGGFDVSCILWFFCLDC
jgi:hypothetical protein